MACLSCFLCDYIESNLNHAENLICMKLMLIGDSFLLQHAHQFQTAHVSMVV